MQEELDYVALGSRIRQARTANNMTQEQLGEACNLSTAHIGHIERGTRVPSLATLFKISTVLHVSVDSLLLDSFATDENLFHAITTMLKGKDAKKIKTFLTTVRALAEKIDEL